jgi:NAD-dependent DNA ligase
MENDSAAVRAIATRELNKAVEHMIGLVTGIIADRHLHDLEIQFLRTWLTENSKVTQTWPGFVIARKIEEVLADGVITDAERSHLLEVMTQMAACDFAVTGSASPEVASLPINDSVTVELKNAGVCHTGEFLFGTRAACERLTLSAGGMPVDAVTKKTDLLVIGTRVSEHWAHTSFGRKIQKAIELQEGGHPIEIISERRWIEVASGSPRV